jgi:hypothetical protein
LTRLRRSVSSVTTVRPTTGNGGTVRVTAAPAYAIALAGGALLGTLTLLAHEHLPPGPDLLGNSAAIWAAFAFVAGRRARAAGAGAAAGAVALVTTAFAYYIALRLLTPRGEAPHVERFWVAAAVLGGPLYGLLGALSARTRVTWRTFATAVLGATFVAEAVGLSRLGGWRPFFVVEVAVGLVLPFALARSRRDAVATLGWLAATVPAGSVLATAAYDLLSRRL